MVCHCCQQPRLEETPLNIAHTSDFFEDEVEGIDTEVRRIRDHIAQLHADCASSLRRRNSIRSSTRSLPWEILSLIFQHACPSPDFFKEWDPYQWRGRSRIKHFVFQLTLGSVLSYWRQVVLSTPQIWSAIGVKYFNDDAMERWKEIIYTWLNRSDGVASQIAISNTSWKDEGLNVVLSPEIDAFLLRNQHRIHSLRLEVNDPQNLVPVLSNFTQLTSLSLTPESPSSTWLTDRTLSFAIDVPLTRFRLRGPFQSIRLDLPWQTITVLDLINVRVDTCTKLLVGCPNLVEFRCSDPAAPEKPHDGSILTEPVEFANLETLSWEFILPQKFSAWNVDLFKYLRAPSLKTLRWNEGYGSWWDPNHAADFLTDLPLTIENLEFVDVNCSSHLFESDLLRCIRHNSQVESILMEGCSKQFIKGILRTLVINADEGTLVFPDLKKIRIVRCFTESGEFSNVLDLETGALLVEALKNRWSGGYIDQFKFVVDVVKYLDWRPSVMVDLDDLFEDGLDLAILHNGTPLMPGGSENPD